MPILPRGHFPSRKPDGIVKCSNERIAVTKDPFCKKTAKGVDELIANRCKNCGRPFVEEGLD